MFGERRILPPLAGNFALLQIRSCSEPAAALLAAAIELGVTNYSPLIPFFTPECSPVIAMLTGRLIAYPGGSSRRPPVWQSSWKQRYYAHFQIGRLTVGRVLSSATVRITNTQVEKLGVNTLHIQ